MKDEQRLWLLFTALIEHFAALGGSARYVGMTDSDIPHYIGLRLAQKLFPKFEVHARIDPHFVEAAEAVLPMANAFVEAVNASGDELLELLRTFCSYANENLAAYEKSDRWQKFVAWVETLQSSSWKPTIYANQAMLDR